MSTEPTIGRYFDTSTAHLTAVENEYLSGHALAPDEADALPRIIVHEYGYWVHVPDADAELSPECVAVFPGLAAVLARARELECAWVNIDRDASADHTLPVYDW